MSPIEATIAAIKLLGSNEKFSYRQVAIQYGCDCTTLAQRHHGIPGSRSTMAENEQALHSYQEQELLRCIKRLTRQGLLPTQAMIRRFASDIAKRELGKGWVDRSIRQYQVELFSRWATDIDRSDHRADSGSNITFTLSFCATRSANMTLSLATRTTWMRKVSS
jgi:hypothetical protein